MLRSHNILFTLCSSRKYPYLGLRKNPFCGGPNPYRYSKKASHISLNFGVLQNPPPPKEIPIPSVREGGGYGYFLNMHISVKHLRDTRTDFRDK